MIAVGMLVLPSRAHAATMESKAGAVTTSGSRLNVRSSASTASGTVATLNKGSYITLISKSGNWWKVEYANGKYGYCHADFITIVEGSPVKVTTQSSNLNVRRYILSENRQHSQGRAGHPAFLIQRLEQNSLSWHKNRVCQCPVLIAQLFCCFFRCAEF